MVVVWWKKTCATARKGVEYLRERGVEFELRDITEDPPPRELLEANLDERNLRAYVNTRSKPYRELGLKSRLPGKAELIDLMLAHPDLIRRPVVARGGKASFGFDPEAIDAVVGS